MLALSDIRSHASRVLQWRLCDVEPTENETKRMNEVFLPDSPVFRSYLAWRHTSLLVALPITLFSAIWNLLSLPTLLAGEDMQFLNLFGKFLLAVPYMASLFLFLAIAISSYWWNNWRRTRSVVKWGWAVSFCVSFLPAIFPLEFIWTTQTLMWVNQSDELYVAFLETKTSMALKYLIVILPLVITFPGGAIRAAVRIRGLLPQSALTCWILVLSAPFYSLLVLTSLVVLIQMVGNYLLIIGAVLLALQPWIFVTCREFYISSFTNDEERELDQVQRITGLVNLCGLAFVVAWAWSSGSLDQFGWMNAVRFVVIGFGNGLVVSLVFCDAFLRMTVTNWKRDSEWRLVMKDSGGNLDNLFGAIEGSIRKAKYGVSSNASASVKDDQASEGSAVAEGVDLEEGGPVASESTTADLTLNESSTSSSSGRAVVAKAESPRAAEPAENSGVQPQRLTSTEPSSSSATVPKRSKIIRRVTKRPDGTLETSIVKVTLHPDGTKTAATIPCAEEVGRQ